MKNAETDSRMLKLLTDIASNAEAAASIPELANALTHVKNNGMCTKTYLVIFNGDSARVYEPGSVEKEVPFVGSSFEAVKNGNVYIDNGIGRYSGYFDERTLAEEGFTAYLSTPIKQGSIVSGALCLAKRNGERFGQEDISTAVIIAGMLSLALSKILLGKQAGEAHGISSVLLEKSANFIIMARADTGEIIEANTGAEVASGYSLQELKQLKLAQLFHGDLTKDKQASGLFRLVRKNGSERVLDLSISRVNRGSLDLLVLTGFDATEKIANENDYKDVVESISDIVFTINGDGEITAINDEVERALGRKKDSLLGAPLGGIVYEHDYKVLGEAMRAERDIRGVELRLLTGSNEQRWFELNGRCYRDSAGNLIKMTGVLRNIHEKKKSSEYASLVTNVTEQSSDAIVIIDTTGVIRFWNKGAENLFGYTKSEMENRTAYELYPDERKMELDRLINKLNSFGSVVEYDTERVRKGGKLVAVRVSASVIKGEDGNVVGYMEIIKDMTSQKKIEEAERRQRELEERNRYLRELDKEKSAFVSSVSHELRTPLTNIHGYSALLAEDTIGMTEEQRNYISIIRSETERLTKLINDLLDQSRMERGKFKINPIFFDLRDLVEKCSCSATAKRKGLYVKWEFGEDLPKVYGDPARIAQVLLNLISNALKFTETGGVTVKVYRKSRAFVQVDVVDTGPGISEEDQKRLFKPFSQVPQPDGQKRGGSGLGLAISKGIIKLHGGKIGVSSKLGSGSRFWFTIRTQPGRKGSSKRLQQVS